MERDRVGRQAANSLFGVERTQADQLALSRRLLTDEQLWQVYQRVPDVRACVDAITRRVATWNWVIDPKLEPKDAGYEDALKAVEEVKRRLEVMNTDGETWQEVWNKVITDLLTFDAGVIENVFPIAPDITEPLPSTARAEEFVALRGSTVFPAVDPHGHLLGYRQSVNGMGLGGLVMLDGVALQETRDPVFHRRGIVFMRLHSNTSSPLGVPLIESIVNEIVTMMRQSEHTMLAFDADEIPPGILVLTGIAGKAAEAAKADLQHLRGKDHKVRVVTNPDPKAQGAHWVELRHTPKDLDFISVINQVRRTIWRVFGVLPVEMGASEDIPRNLGDVQLQVSTSHLINPILELVESKVNASIIPLLVGPEMARNLRFRFDRETHLAPEQQQQKASALNTMVTQGLLTRNEARKELGLPPVDGGDVMTVTTGQGIFKLEDAAAGKATALAPDGDEEVGVEEEAERSTEGVNMSPPKGVREECRRGVEWYEEGHGGDGLRPETVRWARRLAQDEDITADKAKKMRAWLARHEVDKKGEGFEPGQDGFPSPGRVAWALWGGDPAVAWSNKVVRQIENNEGSRLAHVHGPGCGHRTERARLLTGDDLPSEWAPEGPFRDVRTIDLSRLGDSVKAYSRAVHPLYSDARADVIRAAGRHYRDGFNDEAADRLAQDVTSILDKLLVQWRLSVSTQYRMASKLGRDTASDITGQASLPDWEERAEQYAARAMQFLVDPGGMIADLRARLLATTGALTRSRLDRAATSAPRGVGPHLDKADALEALDSAFIANANRIENWSGRLVELANSTMVAGVLAASTSVNEDDPGAPVLRQTEWMVEWVHVGDRRMCQTCTTEGLQGIRPLSTLSTVPGGDTECRARCRCVLVLWTRAEVETGAAQRIGPLDG